MFARTAVGTNSPATNFKGSTLRPLKYQVAVVFMLLGEYTIAEQIHSPGWNDLSSWGDKVGNDLLKHFMKSFPQQA
jgi:hypothetical protein